ncbi:hypothetical protein [Streptomyces ochraceiscleroticus]|uniref:CdiI immunity protein domain-containing protein n=1 Tax=Streptomyces ochraceiscleroticus TaxID=47761 RepID=A0ABW1MIZ4_9ACTN|nr:hypothetical protein [Streptomyces ochraceiscleroticus]
MNRQLEKFIKVYLGLDQAYDASGHLRPTLFAFKEEYVDAVKQGFEELLRDRDFTVEDYERLTEVEFDDEDSLYEYLQRMYQYLFEGQGEQPVPPN